MAAEQALAASGPAPSAPPVSHNMLMNAISSGSADLVRQQITQEPDLINMSGWHRQTALHRACLLGYIDVVRLLLEYGADPNARNNFDETPLHYACKRGLPPVLKCLLERGADVSLVDKMGKGVIHHATEAGNVPTLHLLHLLYPDRHFTCQDNNLQTPLHLAIKAGKLEMFNYLLRKGRSKLKCADRDGNWPIHISAQEGYGYMTWSQLCILGLPALHVVNKHGCTPYDLAAMNDTSGHKELVSELRWQKRQSDRGSAKQHAHLLWFFYLLLPAVSCGAAVVATRFMPAYHCLAVFPVVVYNLFTIKNAFHRLDHVSRWPQPIHAGVFAAGLLHTVLSYMIVILPYLGKYATFKLLSFALAVLILVMYVKLLTKDPGVLTSSAQDEVTGKTLTLVDVCTSAKWQMFCTDCEMIQPRWTKHCRLCERCMLGMDHHCLFLLRCIARNNHALFVWFVLLCVLCMSLYLYAVVLYVLEAYPGLSPWDLVREMLSRDAWVVAMFVLNAVSILWGCSLLVYQYSVISRGYTAYFKPRLGGGRGADTVLTGFEKLMNVLFFLMNRRPRVVNPSMFVSEEKMEVV
ncbi:uncharacterized protein LOC143290823 [Babylonia areolata]|uniref:uncharacterized protein LOC143290823 n=1 Tax=Babylonia areolata TaxID=304850 RepID=UPI003FD397AD